MAPATNFEQRCRACGREATQPTKIPIAGWRDILVRVGEGLDDNNATVMAAGVAFFALLASVPALAAAVSVYGLFAEPADVARQVSRLGPLLPASSQRLLYAALRRVVAQSTETLGLGTAAGLAVSLWTASRGTQALLRAVNAAYGEQLNRRGFVDEIGFSVAATAVAILGGLLAVGLVVVVPAALAVVGIDLDAAGLLVVLRWPLLLVACAAAAATLYRYGPRRRRPRWRWVWPGALVATGLWVGSSMLLSAYVTRFGSYDQTYGSLGAAIILLVWLFVTAYVVLLGAELNAQLELQTGCDTTIGPELPMGQRGAYVADHMGRCRRLPNLPATVRKGVTDLSRRGGEALEAASGRRRRSRRAKDEPGSSPRS